MTNAPRIATVSLNPAIDQTALVPNFAAGAVNRVEREQSDAGGKGVNVASFLAHFGLSVFVTGLLGDANSEPFVRLFAEKGIVDRFVRVPGLTRVNVKIVDEPQDRVTDINFPGLQVSGDYLARLYAAVDALAEDTDWFVLSGSVPSGIPEPVYAELVARLKRQGKTVVLDASGPPFAAAIPSTPDIIKPNIQELEELVGGRLSGHAEVVEAARALVARGIGLVAVSMGSEGAMFVVRDEALLATPPKITVKSTVGAGDAMVAGIVTGGLRGLNLADRARLATAFSLGALSEIGPRLPQPSVVEAAMRDVRVQPIDTRETLGA
jgi:1-phosphofructokinase family hexose kinase